MATDPSSQHACDAPEKDPFRQPHFQEEIESEIEHRRSVHGLNQADAKTNLVGLAFSGGGIRSGAVGLGVLQGLEAAEKLKYVDYLSTVSGGGYAGAYLSSFATCAAQERKKSRNDPDQDASDEKARIAKLPIAPTDEGQESQRLLEFLDTGSKFNRPLIFSNRYAIGLLLNWLVIFSGLVAVASFAAWLFRTIYNPVSLDFLHVLGFEDDLSVCLFPPLMVFVAWLATWGISYWRTGSRAPGKVARWLFGLLLVTAGISVAAILGAGDIDAQSSLPSTQAEGNTGINNLIGTMQTVVLSAVLAALLPYLKPSRLFRSGAPTAPTWERHAYAVASRALLFGVPFLVMSYFVRENISGWQEQRDGSVHRGEIADWNAFDPEYEDQLGVANLWPVGVATDISKDGTQTSISDRFKSRRQNEAVSREYQHYYVPPDGNPKGAGRELARWEHRWWTRWTLLLVGLLEDRLPTDPESPDSRFGHFFKARCEMREQEQEIAACVTRRIASPHFAEEFLPDELWDKPAVLAAVLIGPLPVLGAAAGPTSLIERKLDYMHFLDADARKAWVLNLKAARDTALQVGQNEILRRESLGELTPSEKDFSLRRILTANRKLLHAYYGAALEPATTIYSSNVWVHDQATRKAWFFGSLAVFLLAAVTVNLNATSCHGYYARQISEAWIDPVPGAKHELPLAQLDATSAGFPYHLLSGCVRLYGKRSDGSPAEEHFPFVFSKRFCGSHRLALTRTEDFMGGEYSLADATAVSGAAVSPTEATNPLTGWLLIVTNLRTGQWVRNPAFRPRWADLWNLLPNWPFTPARWLWALLQPADKRTFCLVTDGGFYENLGVEELLLRRCKLIIAVDAGQDERHQFRDFVRLVGRARSKYGIKIEPVAGAADKKAMPRDLLERLALRKQEAGKDSKDKPLPEPPPQWTKQHYAVARIKYPSRENRGRDSSQKPTEKNEPAAPEEGLLIYVKSSLTGDEPLDMIYYQKQNPSFPHHSTSDILYYNADQFLMYVQLGRHLAEQVSEKLPEELDTATVSEIAEAMRTKTGDADWGDAPDEILKAMVDAHPGEAARHLADIGKANEISVSALVQEALRKSRNKEPLDKDRAVFDAIAKAFDSPN